MPFGTTMPLVRFDSSKVGSRRAFRTVRRHLPCNAVTNRSQETLCSPRALPLGTCEITKHRFGVKGSDEPFSKMRSTPRRSRIVRTDFRANFIFEAPHSRVRTFSSDDQQMNLTNSLYRDKSRPHGAAYDPGRMAAFCPKAAFWLPRIAKGMHLRQYFVTECTFLLPDQFLLEGIEMFDLEQFTADCRAALAADSSHKLVREVVARAVSDPNAVLKGIGEPKRAEVQKLYHAPDLTILNVIWGPMMTIMPHDHRMWAVIGIYTGRRHKRPPPRRLPQRRPPRRRGGRARDRCEPWAIVALLGVDIIHSVINPIPAPDRCHPRLWRRLPRCQERSEWNPESLEEGRYDVAKNMKLFEDANALTKHFAEKRS